MIITPNVRYVADLYEDPETGRERWAVRGPGGRWQYAERYGKKAAQALARTLNRQHREW